MTDVLVLLLNFLTIVFLARAVVSWLPIGADSPFRPVVDGLYRITEPVLAPVRRVLPPLGGLDLSVFVVLIVIRVLVGAL
ncbi:MAG: YggT family protein [Acidimicrobiales bacterium]